VCLKLCACACNVCVCLGSGLRVYVQVGPEAS
jgi:hypothetical protein